MKISYNWLKDYLNTDLDPETMAALLTDCGLEVEGMEEWESVRGGLQGVVVGEVVECEKHPDADRLSVTKVDVGDNRLLDVVCGAPNVAKGQKVPLAMVGTTLWMGEEKITLKKTKIRGAVSEGMICAEDELGLGTGHEGIMVLDSGLKPGTPLDQVFPVTRDVVFEIGLTPNRTDAMSHIGVARDLRAVLVMKSFTGQTETVPALSLPDVSAFKPDNHELEIPVEVLNPEACPRYMGVTLTGATVSESPDWLKNRLKAIGLRPINNVVDITNYVLHETGQPLHAFDAAAIKGNKVVVRKLQEGTAFVTLDEVERKLSSEDLMICDTESPMCIGGVFGGLDSGVTETTRDIFLESAWFDPVHIRKTARRHDLQTDASFRFERGVDPQMTRYALIRAALLIRELTGAGISSEIVDVRNREFQKKEVLINLKRINSLIGKNLEPGLIKEILLALDFEIDVKNDEEWLVTVPLCRHDVTREADVVEEILRIYGYNQVEISDQIRMAISHRSKPDPEKLRQKALDLLSAQGFAEIMNNSLSSADWYKTSDSLPEDVVTLLNPLSSELNVMRRSLLYGGLETIRYNLNRKSSDLKLYEYGTVYRKNSQADSNQKVDIRFSESQQIALWLTGKQFAESWKYPDSPATVFDLKAVVYSLLQRLGFSREEIQMNPLNNKDFKGGIELVWGKDKIIGIIAEVSDELLKKAEVSQPVFYAELNWNTLLDIAGGFSVLYRPLPKFPEVRRDLALLLDQEITFDQVEKLAYQTERNLLKKVNLFDIYQGKNIEEGKKSYAVSFILLDENKTLTDKVIDKTMQRLIRVYREQLNAVIR